MRIFHHRDFIKAGHHFTLIFEGWFQSAERLHIGARAHEFIMRQNGDPVDIFDRNYGFGKPVLIPGGFGTFLTFNGKRIALIARKPVFCRDNIGANTLGNEILIEGDAGIHGNRAAIAGHWHAAHAFDSACNISLSRAAAHLIGRQIHCF